MQTVRVVVEVPEKFEVILRGVRVLNRPESVGQAVELGLAFRGVLRLVERMDADRVKSNFPARNVA